MCCSVQRMASLKKTLLEQYSRPRQNGVNAITIREDDKVIEVRMTNGDNEIIMLTVTGVQFAFTKVRFVLWDVRLQGCVV